jgi:hypothetical protein
LKPGTNLKELSNQECPDNVFLTTNLGTFNIEISGIPAIQEVHTVRPNPAHSDIDMLFNEVGRGEIKEMNIYLVNGNVGYLLHAEADNKESYDKYLATFEKMIKSFHIEGTKAIQNNTVLVADANTASPDDVVMLSQKLKKGSGGYNDIISAGASKGSPSSPAGGNYGGMPE